MNEQEIVQYLKDNRTKGVACGFMPRAVLKWVKQHMNILEYCVFTDICLHGWVKYNSKTNATLKQTDIVALPEDFKLEEKPEGEWVEFEIDENGFYRIFDRCFYWFEWYKPLWVYGKDENRSWYLTTFGGWQYNGDNGWFTVPCIKEGNKESFWHYIDGEAKPDIPVKIRFWRVNK